MWHMFGGCIWDIPALVLVVGVTLGMIYQRNKHKAKLEEMEEIG